ncbi:MAG: SgcJ/EcaC family oxidoreductase [Chloroflexi bacterium]|nr:SgcJ/EcaC family oxidoreductase [Chloroflexota bacterium]MBU1660448.1 SgcJ/EcaC family oxidoreductase [Chloroflexota bacterium]
MSQSGKVFAAIAATNERFMTAYNQGDVDGLATFYTENAQLLFPNSDFITGRQAIQAVWQARVAPGARSVKLESIEVEAHGDTAIEVGLYAVIGSEKETLDKGKYIVIWKLENGQWKIHRDILNSSMPPRE